MLDHAGRETTPVCKRKNTHRPPLSLRATAAGSCSLLCRLLRAAGRHPLIESLLHGLNMPECEERERDGRRRHTNGAVSGHVACFFSLACPAVGLCLSLSHSPFASVVPACALNCTLYHSAAVMESAVAGMDCIGGVALFFFFFLICLLRMVADVAHQLPRCSPVLALAYSSLWQLYFNNVALLTIFLLSFALPSSSDHRSPSFSPPH